MQIFIRILNSKTLTIYVNSSDTILFVKELIQYNENIPSDKQLLMFDGKRLKNYKSISEYNIELESVLHLFILSDN